VTTAEKYVAAAYLVVFATVLVYVAIMALKLQRLAREVDELARLAQQRRRAEEPQEVTAGAAPHRLAG
jgi:CcmD family protein